jgi:indolepyruvate decarboxylase
VLLFTGEGALQLTAQEIGSILANGCKPIVFLLNNKGYTIERYLNLPTATSYNNISNWDYTKLPEAFGQQIFAVRVTTNKELDEAILQVQVQCQTKMCLIEMIADPMDAPDIVHKVHEVTLEMQ